MERPAASDSWQASTATSRSGVGGLDEEAPPYTDESGVYFLPTRDSGLLARRDASGALDLHEYLQAHRARVVKLAEGRLHIPANPAHIEMHNPWAVNQAGSTLIFPVADVAQHHIAALCYLVQNGACIFDDIHRSAIPGIERFASLVDVANPYPLTFVEQFSLTEVTAELSTSCYAGMLMLQALGLGGWMFDGITALSVLGASGDPEMPGLGFQYQTDPRWPLPNVTGLPGVLRASVRRTSPTCERRSRPSCNANSARAALSTRGRRGPIERARACEAPPRRTTRCSSTA